MAYYCPFTLNQNTPTGKNTVYAHILSYAYICICSLLLYGATVKL